MGFTTPCFILKNTLQLRAKLEGLGYKVGNEYYINDAFLATDNNEMFGIDEPYYPKQCNGYIHCGTNEGLFLSIAALRDDTNENQWFICDVNHWDREDNGELTVYTEIGEWIFCKSNDDDCARDNHYHKASVNELIEHFKGKENQP
ncbi:hypothetical protein [Bacteroides clarus]|uniref:hypothetical protein n=1 Tax=Bacteroides clarus TaxID=626929 RepID=UPI0020558651|nr:hypothetical protein [Bacteroides clarus]DAZ80190.1 MAG TPA: hypothetical protein [Caudoviricetes sp.]